MANNRKLEQHVALFGESGSGKTVLVSSFYGATQEPVFIHHNLFHVVADDVGQGNTLRRNYLGMRNSSALPMADRFHPKSYSFSIKLKRNEVVGKKAKGAINALHMVWHDYPGEWFEGETSSPEEERSKIETFKALLQSDVAVLLVDAQRLIDNKGSEESYLKYLFGNFRSTLLSIQDKIITDDKKLVEFPRIWMMALSKADLLPQVDAYQFKDILIEKASDEMNDLRDTLAGFIRTPEAFSFGEDFILLSSAKFEPGKILVDRRIGVNLMLPVTAMLPFERYARWANAREMPLAVAENLLKTAGSMGSVLVNGVQKLPLTGVPGKIVKRLDAKMVDRAAKFASAEIHKIKEESHNKHQGMREVLADFRIQLDQGEADAVLIRSKR
jgi:ABC-type dipeptide/oligopeptide/nickel transport system ATPase component